jgi:hypothetical protein
MAAGDNTAKAIPTRPVTPYRQQLADQGRGDMVSENRAANDRFERNSKAIQQQQQGQPSAARSNQDQASPGQGEKRELSFGADRQTNRQQISHAQLKQEQAKATVKSDGPQQGDKKELSFGPGRGQGQGQSQGQDQGLGR